MKLISIIFVLVFSSLSFSQVIDENYGTEVAPNEEQSTLSSLKFTDDTAQRAYDLIAKKLELMEGSGSNRDLFVVGETNGRNARFYAIPGVQKTAAKILEVSQRKNQWRVYGRAKDELIARRLMSYAQREYAASQRPRIG